MTCRLKRNIPLMDYVWNWEEILQTHRIITCPNLNTTFKNKCTLQILYIALYLIFLDARATISWNISFRACSILAGVKSLSVIAHRDECISCGSIDNPLYTTLYLLLFGDIMTCLPIRNQFHNSNQVHSTI